MSLLSARARRSARWLWGLPLLLSATLSSYITREDWPGKTGSAVALPSEDEQLIRAQRLCVLNTLDSEGEIGNKVVFRAQREQDQLIVSYFVYWSTESPWGHKSMLASLAIDSVYSHLFFVLPGVRYLLYGPGDIEGATVVYRVQDDRLQIVEGFADSEFHAPVRLNAGELTDPDQGTVLMTNVWSHQLGARGAAQLPPSGALTRRCYQGDDFIPLTPTIATRFWLGSPEAPRRARPAWQ